MNNKENHDSQENEKCGPRKLWCCSRGYEALKDAKMEALKVVKIVALKIVKMEQVAKVAVEGKRG